MLAGCGLLSNTRVYGCLYIGWVFMLNVPVWNISVMSGRFPVFLGHDNVTNMHKASERLFDSEHVAHNGKEDYPHENSIYLIIWIRLTSACALISAHGVLFTVPDQPASEAVGLMRSRSIFNNCLYLHFRCKALQPFHSLMNDTNLIDSCQAN